MLGRLKLICELGYIGRRYDSSYKLQAKFGAYYLLPKGINALKQFPADINKQVIRNIRNDVRASDRFARHCLTIYSTYSRLNELYGYSFKFFTSSYLHGFDYFPNPLPDAYIKFNKNNTNNKTEELKHYLVECLDDTMPESVMRKKLLGLVNHADSGEWAPKTTYPIILLVCSNDKLYKKAKVWALKAQDYSWTKDLEIVALTLEGLSTLN
jgi:hypothetical protein